MKKVKCEECNIEMEYLETKSMANTVWNKYRCPRCKGIVNIPVVKKL